MGSGKSTSCNETNCEIWKLVVQHNIYDPTSYVPVKCIIQVNKDKEIKIKIKIIYQDKIKYHDKKLNGQGIDTKCKHI